MLPDPKSAFGACRPSRWRLSALALATLALAVLTLRPLPSAAEEKEDAAKAQQVPIILKPDLADAPKQPAPLQVGPLKVTGKVLNGDKKPVGNAQVAVVSFASKDGTGQDPKVLGQTKTDGKGGFALTVKHADSARQVATLVGAKGYGLGWQLVQPRAEAVVRLRPEQVIRGRLIDLQGQPAAGIKVQVCRIGEMPAGAPGMFYRAIRVRKAAAVLNAINQDGQMMLPGDQAKNTKTPALRFFQPPAKVPFWPATVTTDAKGRFTLHGIPQGLGVGLQVHDSRFAVQSLNIKPRKEAKPPEITLVLAPSRTLEGKITDAATGKPVPHARLHIPAGGNGFGLISVLLGNTGDVDWRGRKANNGIRSFAFFNGSAEAADPLPGIDIQADKEGRYKVPLFLSGAYSVEVSGPTGESYLPTTRTINWPKAAARQELQVAVTRGVMLKGKVTETPSGKAVAGAQVDLWAPGLKLPQGVRFPDPLTTGADGTFQALLPPGTWHLLVNSPSGNFLRQKIAAAKLTGEQPIRISAPNGRVVTAEVNDKNHFLHPDAWAALDLKPNGKTQEVALKLQRAVLKGKLVGPDGKPATRAVLFCRHPLPAYAGTDKPNRANGLAIDFFGGPPRVDEPALAPVQVRDGKFEINLRDRDAKYQLYFLDSKNQMGAIAEVSGKDAAPTVKLAACGSARARFLDANGKPRAKYRPQLWLLLPPGPHSAGGPPALRGFQLQGQAVRKTAVAGRLRDLGAWNPATNHDRILAAQADPRHYGKDFATDANGKITFPALIPGATYRIALPNGAVKDFKAESGKTVDLKDITVPDPPQPGPRPLPGFRKPIKLPKPVPKEEPKKNTKEPQK
jgi:hypothetical protein